MNDRAATISLAHAPTWTFKLLYDGACPLCAREVRILQRRNRAGRLAFEDISAAGFDPARYGATHDELMAEMHGVFPDGRVVKRVAAFREAYRAVGLGWLLAWTAWPGLRWIADRAYGLFARNRLRIGRLFGRECPDDACAVHGSRSPRGPR
ncbi:MAG TPA: DUF393 domain-containing protein [Planctomycetota bacterium]|nr:DUF393 domain-containing protein [Planctomycetota bacterium]